MKSNQDSQESFASRWFPETRVDPFLDPIRRFMEIESASGVVLIACTLVALVAANTPWNESYQQIWETKFSISLGDFGLSKPLLLWINDGLMTLFFFVVGLEIKREVVAGELRDPRKAVLPMVAAAGGMVVPAGLYFALQSSGPGERGWGIPMATDIAFVVGVLALLGNRVPFGLKILMLSLAIVDDMGAVVVIALAYSSEVSFAMLGLAAAGFGFAYFLNRVGVRRVTIYIFTGAGIWLAVLKSGIHPTVAGVLMGIMTPATAWIGTTSLREALKEALWGIEQDRANGGDEDRPMPLTPLAGLTREAISPLARLETVLHPWVGFFIMPVFALANAGVVIDPASIGDPIAIAVAVALFVGKPLGIVGFSWLAVRMGLARLPTGVDWFVLLGGGFLAGIGFTMSLFIAQLALGPETLAAGKIGAIAGSILSAGVGSAILLWALGRNRERSAVAPE